MRPNSLLAIVSLLILGSGIAQADETAAPASAPIGVFPADPAAASTPAAQAWDRPLLHGDEVTQQCLVRANKVDSDTPAATTAALTPKQWLRFAYCSIAINIRFQPGSISGYPSATVHANLDADGAIGKMTLDSSGNPDWDGKVQTAVDAMPQLPLAPASRIYHSVTLRFIAGTPGQGIGGSGALPMLSGTTNWSLHHCLHLGAALSCN